MLSLLWYVVAVLIACWLTPYIASVFHASGIWVIGILLILVFVFNWMLGQIPVRKA
jgi:uncharacterized membrane protein (DUF485 family)